MKRALMYASVASMIQQFNMQNIRLLLELGYEVDVACNMECGSTITDEKIAAMKQELEVMGVRVFHVPVPRKVTALGEILKAYKATKRLLDQHAYSLIHCHSPIGGMICRMANRASRGYGKTKMIYTAHGFHFYKGAPIQNWVLFYPAEWLCSRWTDVLITINQEDYALAKSRMKAKQVLYVPGVGINIEKFDYVTVNRAAKRQELGIPEDATMLLSVGELNENKNHETVIRAVADLDVYYIIAGKGKLEKHLQHVINTLNVADKVKLLGFREDIGELCKAADLFVFPSFREGLSVSVMEAMASGLPVVCSRIRGNTDLIDDGSGGALFDPYSVSECLAAIQKGLSMTNAGRHNAERVKFFGCDSVNTYLKAVYCDNFLR